MPALHFVNSEFLLALTGSHIASSLVPASEINGKNKPNLHLRVFFFFIGFELCYSKMFFSFSLSSQLVQGEGERGLFSFTSHTCSTEGFTLIGVNSQDHFLFWCPSLQYKVLHFQGHDAP